MINHDDSHADDLQPVVDMLRAHRPEASPLELDAVKQRVRARVARGRRARSATFMKSRLAIVGMLVVGMLASTTGAGLAITGFTGNDASVAQYGTQNVTPPPSGEVKGGTQEHHPTGPSGTVGGAGGGSPTTAPAETTPLQPSRQVETGAGGGGQLPFTGFLAIPVLIVGLVLLTTGLVLRRRAADA
jgi:hypothetical protein